ncbi:MAG: YHS domain protein [Sphingobacteriaceae bacterium]|nr:YHS domain protein [Cytophagaceae bacterium]
MNRSLFSLSVLLLTSASAFAQKSPVFVAEGAAIRGYDAVAYFKEGKALKGDSKFTYTWNGSDWRFANAEDLALFKATPEKYAPQYGGYCAYGSADGEGHKAPTDPQAWAIVDDKLYLNYNKKVQEAWKKDPKGMIGKADKNWPTLKDKE